MAGTPAKTLGRSSTRKAPVSYRNALSSPYKLKWPEVTSEAEAEVSERLKRELAGLSVASRAESSSRRVKNIGKPTERGRSGALGEPERTGSEGLAVLRKKPECGGVRGDDVALSPLDAAKKRLMVVGVNAVTRQLERDCLRLGLVCLSAKPSLLTHHIMMLAATRGCPVLALPDISSTIAPLLGMKSALALGFKKVPMEDANDPFRELVEFVVVRAPPIQIPWLTVATETTTQVHEKKVSAVSAAGQDNSNQNSGIAEPAAKRPRADSKRCYASLQIKTTIKKKKKKQRRSGLVD